MQDTKIKTSGSVNKDTEKKNKVVSKPENKAHANKVSSNKPGSSKFGIVRIRSSASVRSDIEDTMRMLKLGNQHNCSVYDDAPNIRGMLKKIKDFVTWGEIEEETISLLEEKRKDGDKSFYRLHPPRGGYERKGIKKSFQIGGALGYRGIKINDLIKRMI